MEQCTSHGFGFQMGTSSLSENAFLRSSDKISPPPSRQFRLPCRQKAKHQNLEHLLVIRSRVIWNHYRPSNCVKALLFLILRAAGTNRSFFLLLNHPHSFPKHLLIESCHQQSRIKCRGESDYHVLCLLRRQKVPSKGNGLRLRIWKT